jgi:lysine-specific histone demethylase 1
MQIRNHIVAFWRYDVSQFLSEEAAAAQHEPQHRHLVAAAWGFLHREGYINWGVASAITDRPVLQRQETVIIIGSGLAGAAGVHS